MSMKLFNKCANLWICIYQTNGSGWKRKIVSSYIFWKKFNHIGFAKNIEYFWYYIFFFYNKKKILSKQ